MIPQTVNLFTSEVRTTDLFASAVVVRMRVVGPDGAQHWRALGVVAVRAAAHGRWLAGRGPERVASVSAVAGRTF